MNSSTELASLPIFGFTTFISALAILVIVYTVSDIRYRFRIAVTPIPLFNITYGLILFLGLGTLIIDTWFAEDWFMPSFLSHQAILQAILGIIFLLLVQTWICYAVIKPPIFSKNNHQKFFDALYQAILKGSDAELPTIASEIERSAKSIINLAKEEDYNSGETSSDYKIKKCRSGVEEYANNLLLLIGNRKFCQHIIASSPTTAIAFFEAMANENKYNLPISQFIRNISTEAVANKNSILYHEEMGYRSGFIGYIKPFSQSLYGNYRMVEALATKHTLPLVNGSPLDIDHELVLLWDNMQLSTYCRCTMITWKNYIETNNWPQPSYALNRAFTIVKDSCRDMYKTDISERFHIVANLFKDIINFLDSQQNAPNTTLQIQDDESINFYDKLAEDIFDLICIASLVESPVKFSGIQITLWPAFFGIHNNSGIAWSIIHYKLRRKLYNEVCQLKSYPNYQSAKIFGFLLSVMGLKITDKNNRNKSYYALHKATLKWAQNNYLKLIDIQPDVAASCLVQTICFDRNNSRLVKTYEKGLNLESPKQYLVLNPYDNNENV